MSDHKNTGPNTTEGRAVSSRNATKHGCCADTLILSSENLADYQALEKTWFDTYQPASDAEKHLVQELVQADWFMQRATRAVAKIEAELMEINDNPLHWTEQQQTTLGRFLRYQTTRSNAVKRALKVLEDYLKARAAESQRTEKSQIAQQKLEIYKEKNKPEPTVQSLIQDMLNQKAERDRLAQQTK